MKVQIKEINQKSAWDNLVLSKTREFLQSWDWGEFQKKVQKQPLRLVIDTIAVQGFSMNLGFGISYAYFPRIAILNTDQLDMLRMWCKQKGFVFMRIEPVADFPGVNINNPTHSRNAAQTLILDISDEEEKLLQSMHTKTRYNIRLAQRKGVVVRFEKNVDVFNILNEQTAKRDAFKSHESEYYEKLLRSDFVYQCTAYYNDEPIASNILIIWNGRCTYLHGASSNSSRNVMAPYLLQWEGMKFAKEKECTEYDFWGISPVLNNEETEIKTCHHKLCWDVTDPWTGVTRFKAGFGGNVVEYANAFEIPCSKIKYRLFQLLKKIKR